MAPVYSPLIYMQVVCLTNSFAGQISMEMGNRRRIAGRLFHKML